MPICDACWLEIPAGDGVVCARCGDSLTQGDSRTQFDADDTCAMCRIVPPPFVRAVAYGLYDGRMRDAIHALKYDRLHPAARVLGRMLAGVIAQLAGQAPAEMLVVAVPLHRQKLSERGFNQARLLAAEALRALRATHPAWRLTLTDVLVRARVTESQAGLTPRQRRLNVRAAFGVRDAAAVEGRDVLVVDDILTTGATARAAAQALKDAGAKSVWVATLARARRRIVVSEEFSWQGAGSAQDGSTDGYAESMHAADHQPSL